MRPLDPRLLRTASTARRWVLLAAALQVLVAALVVGQALLLADALAAVVADRAPAASVLPSVYALGVVVMARALVAWVQERYAHRAATRVVAQLRDAVLSHLAQAGVAALHGDRGPALTTLVTRGLDALDGYLVRYLPQLLATAILTPALLGVVLVHDRLSAVLMALTLPMIPLFMALVGWSTQRFANARLARMQQLGAQLLDLVAGLPTLRALGRASQQSQRVRAVGQAYRHATRRVLQQAFLSGLVLEMFTTLSTALVAVGIGFRLLGGDLDLRTALVVLILAPEVYLPLRRVGTHFHASTDGLAAAAQAFAVLDEPVRPPVVGPRLGTVAALRLEAVSVAQDGRAVRAPSGLDAVAVAGRITALVGHNGVGKSTALALALGLRSPTQGRVLLRTRAPEAAEIDLADVDRQQWQQQVAWAPQRPVLVPGTLADNARLVAPDATDDELDAAAARVGFLPVVQALPRGWRTAVGSGGVGLSAGQRQRLALTRVFLRIDRGAHVVVLDEPTAHLDLDSEAVILRTLRELADDGALVLVVAHRPSLQAIADAVVVVQASTASDADRPTAARRSQIPDPLVVVTP